MTKMEKLQRNYDYVKECNESIQAQLRMANCICVKLKQGKPLTENEVAYLNKQEEYYNSLPYFEQN